MTDYVLSLAKESQRLLKVDLVSAVDLLIEA